MIAKNFLDKISQSYLIKKKSLFLMLLPAILYAVIFYYLPIFGIVLAFKDFNYADGILGSPWANFDNFKFLIASRKLWSLTRNTFLYNCAFITIEVTLQVTFAIMLSDIAKMRFKKLTQSFMFLPYFISWVVVAAIVQGLLGYETGVINNVLGTFNIERINIYSDKNIWPFLLIILRAWKNVGYGSIIYLASIASIAPSMYEAADIDGASHLQKIFRITLPTIKPTIIIMVLLAIGQIFRGDFGLFYQLVGNNAQILEVADIIDLFVYRTLITSGDIGMSAAAGLYQSVLCFTTIMIANGIIRKVDSDYSLF